MSYMNMTLQEAEDKVRQIATAKATDPMPYDWPIAQIVAISRVLVDLLDGDFRVR